MLNEQEQASLSRLDEYMNKEDEKCGDETHQEKIQLIGDDDNQQESLPFLEFVTRNKVVDETIPLSKIIKTPEIENIENKSTAVPSYCLVEHLWMSCCIFCANTLSKDKTIQCKHCGHVFHDSCLAEQVFRDTLRHYGGNSYCLPCIEIKTHGTFALEELVKKWIKRRESATRKRHPLYNQVQVKENKEYDRIVSLIRWPYKKKTIKTQARVIYTGQELNYSDIFSIIASPLPICRCFFYILVPEDVAVEKVQENHVFYFKTQQWFYAVKTRQGKFYELSSTIVDNSIPWRIPIKQIQDYNSVLYQVSENRRFALPVFRLERFQKRINKTPLQHSDLLEKISARASLILDLGRQTLKLANSHNQISTTTMTTTTIDISTKTMDPPVDEEEIVQDDEVIVEEEGEVEDVPSFKKPIDPPKPAAAASTPSKPVIPKPAAASIPSKPATPKPAAAATPSKPATQSTPAPAKAAPSKPATPSKPAAAKPVTQPAAAAPAKKVATKKPVEVEEIIDEEEEEAAVAPQKKSATKISPRNGTTKPAAAAPPAKKDAAAAAAKKPVEVEEEIVDEEEEESILPSQKKKAAKKSPRNGAAKFVDNEAEDEEDEEEDEEELGDDVEEDLDEDEEELEEEEDDPNLVVPDDHIEYASGHEEEEDEEEQGLKKKKQKTSAAPAAARKAKTVAFSSDDIDMESASKLSKEPAKPKSKGGKKAAATPSESEGKKRKRGSEPAVNALPAEKSRMTDTIKKNKISAIFAKSMMTKADSKRQNPKGEDVDMFSRANVTPEEFFKRISNGLQTLIAVCPDEIKKKILKNPELSINHVTKDVTDAEFGEIVRVSPELSFCKNIFYHWLYPVTPYDHHKKPRQEAIVAPADDL